MCSSSLPNTGGLCSIAEESEWDIGERDEAVELAIKGERLCRNEEWTEGIKCLEDALEMGPTDPVTLSALYSQLGNAYYIVKSYDKAVDIYRRDLELTRREGDRRGEANAAANMSNTLKVIGRYQDSSKMCQHHLKLCRELGDKNGEAEALHSLGTLCHIEGKRLMAQTGDSEQSKELLQKAIKHFKENLELVTYLANQKAQCKVYSSLGSTYCVLGDFEKAAYYFKEKLKSVKELGDTNAVRRAYTCLANTYLCTGEYQSAIDCYIGSIKLSQQLGDKALQAQGCFSIANAYSLMGDFPNAVEYHMKHLRFAEELEDIIGEAKACWCLGNAYTELQDHSKAYLFTCRHLELSIQIGDEENVAIARKNLSDLTAVMEAKEAKDASLRKSSERGSLLTLLFGKRKSSSPFLEVPYFNRLSVHRWSCGESSSKVPVKLQRSGSGTPLVGMTKDSIQGNTLSQNGLLSEPSKQHVQRDNISTDKDPVCTKDVLDDNSVDKCSPVREESTKAARPCSPEESKESVDDSLIDLILESQGRRMDDQRSAVPFTLRSNESKEVEPKEKSREERGEELIALVRRTPEPVIREQNRRLSQGSMDSLNEGFIDQLMTAQNARLEDQRSPDPFLERSQTLPGEDFLNLLLQLQSMRMEDQRSPFPNPFV